MAFCKVRCWMPVLLSILFWLVTGSIDCQQALDNLSPPGVTNPAEESTWRPVSFGSDGLTISNKNGTSKIRFHGYVEGDGHLFTTNLKHEQHNVFVFRRVRPLVDGRLANVLDFHFMPDFGAGNTVIPEVFVQMQPLPATSLSVGKFKTPVGLEVLRSDRDLTFVERSMASDLIPVRDLGAQLEGSFFQHAITYELGYFSGSADGIDANFEWRGTNAGVVRAFFHPFAPTDYKALQRLGLGIAASDGHRHGVLPTFKTIGQQTFFRYAYGTIADGQQKRVSPQAYYYFRSIEFLGEYVASGQTVAAGATRRYLSNHGWGISGSFVLTGERNSYEGIQPAHAFEPFVGLKHMGAWQIAFRRSAVEVDAAAFPQYALPSQSARHAGESAVGLNWYINRYTKIMADYEYTTFQMAGSSIPRLCPERVTMVRLQFSF